MIAVRKIMTLASSGNKYQDTHTPSDKMTMQDYYSRTTRSLGTQHLLGKKLNPDIDQAMDVTYKLDRKIFQTMITKWTG